MAFIPDAATNGAAGGSAAGTADIPQGAGMHLWVA